MRKPKIAIKKTVTDYSGLVRLGNAVVGALTGNGLFPVPIPTIVSLQNAVTDVETALTKWGDRHNHGTKADLSDLRTKSIVLRNLLISMAQYVEVTASIASGADYNTMASMIDSSGFTRRGDYTRRGVLQAVRNFRSVISRNIFRNQVKLDWSKPENTGDVGNVKSYNILRAATQDVSTAVQVATVTKSTYLDTNTSNAVVTWSYWVEPVNAAGKGMLSDDVTVTLLAGA